MPSDIQIICDSMKFVARLKLVTFIFNQKLDENWQCIISHFVHMVSLYIHYRGGNRTATTYKMERFVIIVNDWKPLTVITKRSILDVTAVLDPPLFCILRALLQTLPSKTFYVKYCLIYITSWLYSNWIHLVCCKVLFEI